MTIARSRTLAVALASLPLLGLPAHARVPAPEPPRETLTLSWVWPLDPTPAVMRGFDPPADRWGAGHRGVDLLGSASQPVMAIHAGVVTVARPVAGRGVVVVDHGDLRSTYEPVTAAVHVGEHVLAGEVLGLLQTTYSHCPPDVCLHLGLRRGDVYLDPLSVLGPQPVRLKPVASSYPTPGGRVDPGGSERQPSQSPSGGDVAGVGTPPVAAAAGVVLAVALLAAALFGRGQARG